MRSHGDWISFVEELIASNFLRVECALCEGEFNVSGPLGVCLDITSNLAHRVHPSENKFNILYKGEDSQEMIKLLREFPFGRKNLCIWFKGFNWENHALSESFRKLGYANTDVLLFALTSPQKTYVIDAYKGSHQEYAFSNLFVTTGKGGLEGTKDTILEPVITKYFGENRLESCAYS